MFDLTNKVALVTGARRGMGKAHALALSGLGARLRDWAWKRGRNWLGAGLLFVVAYLVVVNLIHLPLGAYLGFVRPRAYGL